MIERIFGILKRSYRILLGVSPELPKAAQAKLILVLCCLHNFRRLNEDDIRFDWEPEEAGDNSVNQFGLSTEAYTDLEGECELSMDDLAHEITADDVIAGEALRDQIAARMWDDYIFYLADNDM